MKASFVVSIASLVAIAGSAFGQTMANPRFHLWNWRHPAGGQVDARLKAIVQVDCFGYSSPMLGGNANTADGQTVDPRAAARIASEKIIARLYGEQPSGPNHDFYLPYPQDLDPNNICISFFSFARDEGDCDIDIWNTGTNPNNDGPGPRHLSMLRCFREQDRLPGVPAA